MLKNIKQDIKNIILLLFIVGILSLIVYVTVYSHKEYTKNVNLNIETYNYKNSESQVKDETIKLESMISVKDYILDMKFNGDKLMAISDHISNNKSEINIYDIDIENKKIKNVETIKSENDIMYKMGSISPSRDIIVYDTISENKSDQFNNVKSIVYNMSDESKVTLDFYFNILGWIPDSSGFYGYKKGELFEYSIDDNQINNKYKYNLKSYGYIDKIAFSQDGTKLYSLNISKNEICIYDLKNDTTKKINSVKNIYDFEVLNDNNILIKASNSKQNYICIYNIQNHKKKVIKGIHLDDMYISKDKTKLVTVYYTGNSESTIDVYNISGYDSDFDFYKLGSIPMIKGIPYIDISDNNKLAYFVDGASYTESNIYIYDITNKK
ncbi:Uncharacterised protein [[Clostridium] sordellii]|uniref:hypothetical protein n=1 Tax=Paraclostridium sordellii TaxID=1505 RepID=UPI0005DD9B62|nr:hypothetical protein [Paeniclostridium sordellii]CEQ08700.1 Uncharacterised protein [[Clostridium] sordellii] [Paeniclostridium sordellii]